MYTTIIQTIDNNNNLIDTVTISEKLNINVTKGDIINYQLGNLKYISGQVINHKFSIKDDDEYFKRIDITEMIILMPLKS